MEERSSRVVMGGGGFLVEPLCYMVHPSETYLYTCFHFEVWEFPRIFCILTAFLIETAKGGDKPLLFTRRMYLYLAHVPASLE